VVESAQFPPQDFARFVKGHNMARIMNIGRVSVISGHSEGSHRAFDVVSQTFGSSRSSSFVKSVVQSGEYSQDLPRSAEKLAIINEPSVSPFTNTIVEGVFMSLVDRFSQDNRSFERAIWFALSGPSVDIERFATG
jgi:hypothetical protein